MMLRSGAWSSSDQHLENKEASSFWGIYKITLLPPVSTCNLCRGSGLFTDPDPVLDHAVLRGGSCLKSWTILPTHCSVAWDRAPQEILSPSSQWTLRFLPSINSRLLWTRRWVVRLPITSQSFLGQDTEASSMCSCPTRGLKRLCKDRGTETELCHLQPFTLASLEV